MEPVTFESIPGQCTAKRALEIAAAGGHAALIVSPDGCYGLQLQQALAFIRPEDSPAIAHLVRACWCGGSQLQGTCRCSDRARERYARRLESISRDYDIVVAAPPVPFRELAVPASQRGTSLQSVARALYGHRQVEAQGRDYSVRLTDLAGLMTQLDEPGHRTLEMAARRLSLTADRLLRIMRVARTIADLRASTGISARDVAEAVQYRDAGTM